MPKSRKSKRTTTKKPANIPTLPIPANESSKELLPPPTSIDPLDPGFRSAWQEWTASALGRLDQLPKLDQAQLAAIARAAAAGAGAGTLEESGLGIDLPASLAALFEAKLTLDREKAKLVRMQKELQGYRAAAGQP